MQTALSYLFKSRMLKLVQQEEPDVMVFTHPFPLWGGIDFKTSRSYRCAISGYYDRF